MKRQIGLVAALALALSGCGMEPGSDTAATEGNGAGEAPAAAETAAAGSDVTEERIFDESVKDPKCELLSREEVAEITGVPADALEEMLKGCLYTWEDGHGREDGTIYLGSVMVHDNLKRARGYHARFTEDVTSEEVAEGQEQVQGELAEQEAAGEMSETDAAAGSALAGAMPEMDFTHRDLEGIGDEAQMDNRGTVYVRLGNVTISFSGKTDGEDEIDPEVAAEVARTIVSNLEARAGG